MLRLFDMEESDRALYTLYIVVVIEITPQGLDIPTLTSF